jgi:sirohydrochlorin cobaltochelatase
MMRAAGDRIQEALDANPSNVPLHETLLVVVGRGASDPDANSNVSKVTRILWEGFGFGWAETAYSGVTFPLVDPGLEHAARLGYKRIIVFPYFLFTGILVQRIYDA